MPEVVLEVCDAGFGEVEEGALLVEYCFVGYGVDFVIAAPGVDMVPVLQEGDRWWLGFWGLSPGRAFY